MLYRRKMVINLVSMLGGEASLVRIHKLLFLYSFKAVSPSYDFIPHKYGCYSFVLHDDIDAMVADGTLVRLGEESDSVFDSRIRQNWNGKVPEKMVLKHADAIPLATIARNFGKMSDEELIDFTYHVRPFYCINSQMLDRFSTDSELLSRIDRQRDKALSAERGLYTIGYEGLSLDKFLKKLICNNIKYLIDEEGKRVFVDNANSKEKLFCPICKKTVFPRRGEIRIHHYAHTHGQSCNDSWKYEDKTKWHIDWQAMFPEESRECTLSDSTNHRHLADVFLEDRNTVIVFQHGSITNKRFDKRNEFFTSLGNKVIWVFDLIENTNQDELSFRNEDIAEWQNPLESFKTFKFKENDVDIFFQIKNEDIEASDGFYLLKVIGVDCNGFELFQYSKYSKKEFLNYAIEGADKES